MIVPLFLHVPLQAPQPFPLPVNVTVPLPMPQPLLTVRFDCVCACAGSILSVSVLDARSLIVPASVSSIGLSLSLRKPLFENF